MKRTSTILAVLLGMMLVLSLVAVAEDAAKVGGTWEMTSQGRQGPMTSTLTIDQDGNKFKGTLKGARGENPIEGTVDGNKISFTVERETPNGKMTMNYTGKVDGDSIKGTVKMGENEREWTAKKQK
jgi:hypothetical protein